VPRVGLTRDKVIEEAGALADEVGYERVTLAGLAERCGVRVPSLYKHVEGLDAVRAGVAVSAVAALGDELRRRAVGRARGEALRALARGYRAWAGRHPGRYAATLRAPASDEAALAEASASVLEVVFAVLAGYGIEGDDAVDATRILRSALHGFCALEAGGGFGLARDVERSFTRMIDGLDAAFSQWVRPAGV
jgi:AcrR family transcriptional regulator